VNGRFLLRLYPKSFRERYGDELLALLEELPATPQVVLDLLAGAVDAHVRPQIPRLDRPEPPRSR
jgi:hypothetical protein